MRLVQTEDGFVLYKEKEPIGRCALTAAGRAEEAARLLRERPDLMVSEIADMVGVNSLQYFGKIFKSHFGMTPRRYRSSQTGQDRED